MEMQIQGLEIDKILKIKNQSNKYKKFTKKLHNMQNKNESKLTWFELLIKTNFTFNHLKF